MIKSFGSKDTEALFYGKCPRQWIDIRARAQRTMAKNKMRPIHPGEILREEFLVPLGMSANALAIALRVPAPRVNDVVLERRAITPDTALRLAQYFGGDAESWMNLQITYDLRRTEQIVGEKITSEIVPRAA